MFIKRMIGTVRLSVPWLVMALVSLSASQVSASVNNENSPLGVNLTSPLRYGTDFPFINEMKRAELFTQTQQIFNTGELDRVDFDANGWPRSLTPADGQSATYDRVSYVLYGGDYDGWGVPVPEGGLFMVYHEGEGTLTYLLGAQKVGDCGTGCEKVQITPANGLAVISITATDPQNTGNYLRNVQVIHPGGICNGDHTKWYPDDSQCPSAYTPLTALKDTETFHPDYLNDLKHYRALRFMDSSFANYFPLPKYASSEEMLGLPLKEWADRSLPDDAAWSSEDKGGWPVETMMALANELDASPWFTVPVWGSDDYYTQFANLVKTLLPADQVVYVEYGNEIWNGGFTPGTWVHHKGIEAWPDEADTWKSRMNYFARRSVEVCSLWKQAWGDQAGRVNCVMGAQSASDWITKNYVLDCPLWVNDARNPNPGVRCGEQMDVLAIAPYFGGYIGDADNQATVAGWFDEGAAGMDKLFKELTEGGQLPNSPAGGALARAKSEMAAHATLAANDGLELVAYEAGQHLAGTGSALDNSKVEDLFKAANLDERMGTLYHQYLKDWKASGGHLMSLYKSVGPQTKYGSWGMTTYQGEAPSTKLRGVNRFAAFNPCWWTGCTNTPVPVDTDDDALLDQADNCSWVSNPDQQDSGGDGYGNACDADLNNNLLTNGSDVLELHSRVFKSEADSDFQADGDFNSDGRVDFRDAAFMKVHFGEVPGLSSVDGG
ncbi:MAG: hypothetical protein ACWA5X_12355 [bacterium]